MMITKGIVIVLLALGLVGAGTVVAFNPASIGIDWFEPAEKRVEARMLAQLRANGVYDDPGKRFVIHAQHVEGAELRDVTVYFRNNPNKSVVLAHATVCVQPEELQVRLAASHATFQDDDARFYFADIEWTLDADGAWPFAAW